MRAISSSGLETCGAALASGPRRYPAGFVAVCVSVAGERFSGYLLLSQLLLYLNEQAGFNVTQATSLLGYFVGLAYFLPLLGGLLTDRVLGPWGAGIAGSALAAAGYGALVGDGAAALYAGLGLIVVGSGIYKASPQALTDRLYGVDDARREAGFSLLYLMVNLGALLGPVVGTYARTRYGWWSAFVIASAGALVSHLSLVVSHRRLRAIQPAPAIKEPEPSRPPIRAPGGGLSSLCLTALLFTVAQLQTSSVLVLWARDHTDRHVLGREVPVTYLPAVPALLVVVLSPLLALGFQRLGRWGKRPSTAAKLQLGMLLTALAYVPLIAAALGNPSKGLVSMAWLLACLFCLAAGELLVSALGPALMTRLAPPHRRARWLGAWFGCIALGCIGAGKLGTLWGTIPPAHYFTLILLIPLAGAAIAAQSCRAVTGKSARSAG